MHLCAEEGIGAPYRQIDHGQDDLCLISGASDPAELRPCATDLVFRPHLLRNLVMSNMNMK